MHCQRSKPLLCRACLTYHACALQLRELLRKYNLSYWRTPSYNLLRLFICTFMALVYGCIYYTTASYGSTLRLADMQNVMGVMYSSVNYLGMINLMTVLPLAGMERIVFYRSVVLQHSSYLCPAHTNAADAGFQSHWLTCPVISASPGWDTAVCVPKVNPNSHRCMFDHATQHMAQCKTSPVPGLVMTTMTHPTVNRTPIRCRERAASMYHPVAYGLSLTLVEIPYMLAQAVVFCGTAYFMVGFSRLAEPFWYFFLMFLAALLFFNTFGQFLVCVTPNQQLAQVGGPAAGEDVSVLLGGANRGVSQEANACHLNSHCVCLLGSHGGLCTLRLLTHAMTTANQPLSPPPSAQILASSINLLFSLFCGFVITYPNIPDYWKWLNRLSPTTWMLHGLGSSQLGNVEVRAASCCGVTCSSRHAALRTH